MKYYLHFLTRSICFLLFTLCVSHLLAQNKISYYKKNGEETRLKDSAYYLRIVRPEGNGNDTFYRVEEFYFHNDSVKLNAISKTAQSPLKYHGRKYEFYENGRLKDLENFFNGTKIDSAFYFYPNNQLKKILFYPNRVDAKGEVQVEKPIYVAYYDSLRNRTLENGNGLIRFSGYRNNYEEGTMLNSLREGEWHGKLGKDSYVEIYSKDKLISGITTKENGVLINYDSTNYMIPPQFPGGISRLMGYIGSHYIYPKEAIQNNVSGVLLIMFMIDHEGNVRDAVVKEDLGFGTGDEGIRVLKKAGKWKPGVQRGEAVNVAYILPIRLNAKR
ncbi:MULTISPECIES: energy transducer TonB [Sphingobacterium]|uniref:energy transducer TonB n=1 Tax=Sphingobacterium TaxID=28453 RepID=UPI00129CB667|nr:MULTISPECIES: energy transducer TonB [Sphingobacterium]MCS4168270.1 antitoxin component YwqK of YwqJK toxin-antitoxin module [Sphingobacterium sp. BIGb0116]